MGKNNRIGFVGLFNFNNDKDSALGGGQLTKTRNIYKILTSKFKENQILTVDTYNWKQKKITLLQECFHIARKSDIVIIMPNKNGIKIILPIFGLLKMFFHYQIVYPVVGGWIVDLLNKNKYLIHWFKKVDYILPETKKLADQLKKYNRNKIEVMPVFSSRQPIDRIQSISRWSEPYVFCTFSRVLPQKGIDEAIKAINTINKIYGKVVCRLEVCGPIDEKYKEHYDKMFSKYTDTVRYKGILSNESLIETLSNYYMLLFPTFYEGEAFPATLCEAYMSGLPVIASDWKYNSELILNGVTGYLFPVHDVKQLMERIIFAIDNPKKIYELRNSCLKKGKTYLPENVTKNLLDWLIQSLDS